MGKNEFEQHLTSNLKQTLIKVGLGKKQKVKAHHLGSYLRFVHCRNMWSWSTIIGSFKISNWLTTSKCSDLLRSDWSYHNLFPPNDCQSTHILAFFAKTLRHIRALLKLSSWLNCSVSQGSYFFLGSPATYEPKVLIQAWVLCSCESRPWKQYLKVKLHIESNQC